jgi:predicted transcriptional regulator
MIAWSTSYNFLRAASALERLKFLSQEPCERIIALLRSEGSLKTDDIAGQLHLSIEELEVYLQQLSEMQLIYNSAVSGTIWRLNHYRYLRLMTMAGNLISEKVAVEKL